MNIDIDLGELRTRLEKTRQTISSFHKSGQTNLRDYEVSKKNLTELNSGLTWTEKNLGGIFGGDKEKLKKIQSLKERISELRQLLKKIDTDLKSENNKVRDVVTEHLSKNSKRFRDFTANRQTNQQLLNEVSTFLSFLKKAKKGISDALLFTSWDSLLNHPKAKEELNKFMRLVDNLQLKLNQYETLTGTNFLNSNRLGDYVQFSTERIAMDSFRNLNDLINKISTDLATKTNATDKEINSLMDMVQQQVLK